MIPVKKLKQAIVCGSRGALGRGDPEEKEEDHPWEERYPLGSRRNFKAKVYSPSGKEGGKADSFQNEGMGD